MYGKLSITKFMKLPLHTASILKKACALTRETIVLQVENAIIQKLWK